MLVIQFLLFHLLPHVSNVYLLLPLTEVVKLLLAPTRCVQVPFRVIKFASPCYCASG